MSLPALTGQYNEFTGTLFFSPVADTNKCLVRRKADRFLLKYTDGFIGIRQMIYHGYWQTSTVRFYPKRSSVKTESSVYLS
jgi:hypothetical protein